MLRTLVLRRRGVRFLSTILLIAGMQFMAGCSGLEAVTDLMSSLGDLFASEDDTADPPATLPEDFKSEIQVELLWDNVIGKGPDRKYLKLTPAVRDGKVFAGSYDGLLQALVTTTGDVAWEIKTDFNFSAGPGLGAGAVIMGTTHAQVVSFDSATGQQKWSTFVSSEVLTPPVIGKGYVLVRTTDGKLVALREQDGNQVWSVEQSVPALSIRGAGAPLILGDRVIIGSANGKLAALQLADGKMLWETTVVIPTGRSEVERLIDLDVDPLDARGSVYISSYQSGTFAVSDADGEVIWRTENVSSYTGISYDSRYLYISDGHGEVSQLDQRNGAALWKQKDLHNRGLTLAAVYGNYVVAGDFEGYVHWLSATDGRLLARQQIAKAPIKIAPVVVDGIVYVYAQDGTLAALRVK